MATPFRDWPWPLQAIFYLGLAIVIVIAGLWIPGLPNQRVRADLETAKAQLKPLQTEVDGLRVYQQRRVELQGEMDALQKQLATLQTIVPEEKQVDQFIVMLQTAASTSGVSIRRITTKPVVSRDYHFEMPFEVEADGPYFSMLDFFGKLSRLSRIINVGDLKFAAIQPTVATRFTMTPGTTVTGTMTVTTFFTEPGQQLQPAAPTKPGKR
ncbi:MAG TPA: type 4a pilus biogenesis protein PilO [Candidatus Acidoferrales bacterium]|nr:type 4a pilus biogenesis protein PilO [Candidatus Acidoferrales bacterium]